MARRDPVVPTFWRPQRGDKRMKLREPLPAVLGYEVAAEPWRTHLAGSVVLADDVAVGED
jgi:hypothetical protein